MKITPDRKMYKADGPIKTENSNEMVNHPAHYAGDIECRDAMIQQFGREGYMEFCVENAFKYIWRCKKKGVLIQDLEKAVWYLNDFIKLMKGHE